METSKNPVKTESMYCVKCRMKVIVTGPKKISWPNNRHAIEGHCPHCSTKSYKVVKSDWA